MSIPLRSTAPIAPPAAPAAPAGGRPARLTDAHVSELTGVGLFARLLVLIAVCLTAGVASGQWLLP